MAVSKRLRFEILRRDKHTCRYCGRSAPLVSLHVDHIVPTTLGGSNDPTNLVAACADCNSGKSSTSLGGPMVADVDSDVVRWRRAVIVASQENQLTRSQALKLKADFDDEWAKWSSGYRQKPIARASDWWSTVEHLMSRGLTMDDLVELIDVAMTSRADDVWRYFCGCCWKRVEKLEKRAAELVHNPPPAAREADPQSYPGPPVTNWTPENVDQAITQALDIARNLNAEQIGFATCAHQFNGYCEGDAVCAVQWATNLEWIAFQFSSTQTDVADSPTSSTDIQEVL